MAEITKPSQNQKQESSWEPGPLTQQEIESLRQDKKEAHKRFDELWEMDHQRDKEI